MFAKSDDLPVTVLRKQRKTVQDTGKSVIGGQNLAHIFVSVDMRLAHAGLIEFLKKKKIKVKEGDYIVFMNSSRTIVKMFCNSDAAILHYKKAGTKIDPGVIRYLPKYCNGAELDIDGAKAEHLKDLMKRRDNK